jgi:hypothetical protein
LALKIISEERRGSLGDSNKRNLWILVNPPLKPRQKSVIGDPVEPPKEAGPSRIKVLFVCKFLEAMKEYVNDDNIGVQTVDSGRENKVEAKSMNPPVPCARERIDQ